MDCTLPGSFVHGIFQGRILGWVAISSSRGSSWPRDWVCISCSSCISGRSFAAEPPGKLDISPKGGEIFVGKCSHQSWEGRDMVPARPCGRCFTVTTTCHQSFQTGLVKLPSQLKSPRLSQFNDVTNFSMAGKWHRPLIWVSLKLTLSLLQAWADLVPLIPFLFSLLWNVLEAIRRKTLRSNYYIVIHSQSNNNNNAKTNVTYEERKKEIIFASNKSIYAYIWGFRYA